MCAPPLKPHAWYVPLAPPPSLLQSTLVKLLNGQLVPDRGEVSRSKQFRVATFTQHHMDQLNLEQSPLEHMLEYARLKEPETTVDEVMWGGAYMGGAKEKGGPL